MASSRSFLAMVATILSAAGLSAQERPRPSAPITLPPLLPTFQPAGPIIGKPTLGKPVAGPPPVVPILDPPTAPAAVPAPEMPALAPASSQTPIAVPAPESPAAAPVPELLPVPGPAVPVAPAVTPEPESPPAPPASEFAVAPDTPAPQVAEPLPAASEAAPTKEPTLLELGKKIEVLGKNLTIGTGDEQFKMILGGRIVADALFSSARPVASGVPFFLAPGSPFGYNTQTFDLTARQTTLFALFSGPDVLGLKAGGLVLMNLYDNTVIADRYGLLPINAFGELRDDEWRFAAGLQMDVFNPANPTVLPFSLLGTSGNTGFYRGQLRVERFIKPDENTQFTLTGALSEPLPTLINDQLRISEDNGFPNVEGRAAVGLGPMTGTGMDARRPIEVGVSGVAGQLRTVQGQARVVSNVSGLGSDIRWAPDSRCGVQGEVYLGQGLGSYGTSALQNVNPATFRAIRSGGFWAEAYYYWCPDMLHTHVGYGVDDTADADAGAGVPVRNETYYATTMWDVTSAFRVSLQVSYLKTAYSVLKDNNGVLVHTQFLWKF